MLRSIFKKNDLSGTITVQGSMIRKLVGGIRWIQWLKMINNSGVLLWNKLNKFQNVLIVKVCNF
jgi:hypothetical protein